MSMLADLAPSLLTAARGVIAAFGCLCIVSHVVIPALVVVGEFVVYDLPTEIAQWQLMRAQQSELQALEDRVAMLKKRRARRKRAEAQRAHEDYQMQASRRQEALRRKQKEAEREAQRLAEEEERRARDERQRASAAASDGSSQPAAQAVAPPATEKTSIPKRQSGLRLRSPNIIVDRRPVSAYAKASAGVIKPVGDADRNRHAASTKARVLSLGSIFDEGDVENAAPAPRMWAH